MLVTLFVYAYFEGIKNIHFKTFPWNKIINTKNNSNIQIKKTMFNSQQVLFVHMTHKNYLSAIMISAKCHKCTVIFFLCQLTCRSSAQSLLIYQLNADFMVLVILIIGYLFYFFLKDIAFGFYDPSLFITFVSHVHKQYLLWVKHCFVNLCILIVSCVYDFLFKESDFILSNIFNSFKTNINKKCDTINKTKNTILQEYAGEGT